MWCTMVFYEVKNLTCSVDLEPQYFGPRLKDYVAKMVVAKVQWSSISYAISSSETVNCFVVHAHVPDIGSYDLAKGQIHEDTGAVQFHVKYNAIVMRPREDDVLDAKVTDVEQTGVTCHFGPLFIFLSYESLGDYEFDQGHFRKGAPDEDGNYDTISLGSIIRVKVFRVHNSPRGMDVFCNMNGSAGLRLIADPDPDE